MEELELLRKNFLGWKAELELRDDITLEESLALFKSYDLSIPRIMNPGIDYPLKFYRARVIGPDSKEDLGDPQTFSYPPAIRCKDFQRANAPGFPVFYGAMDGQTACEELRLNGDEPLKKGDLIYLAEWRMKPGSKSNLCYLTQPGIVEDSQLFGPITKNVFSQFPGIFKDQDPVFSQTQRFLYEELSNLFLTGKHIQTGILAHEILYNTPKFEGLEISGLGYPSCANHYRGVNFALLPDFVDAHLELIAVRKMAFDQMTNEGAQTKVSYFGEIKKGRVQWQTYASELMIHDYGLEVVLAIKWTAADVRSGTLVISGQETGLREFCDAIVSNLDPTQYQMPGNEDELFKNKSELVMVYDHKFEEGQAALKLNDQINPLQMLRIKTPVKAYTHQVPWKKVLKGI